MKYISKDEYKEWEKEVISSFYHKKHFKTDIIPVNGEISYLKHSKHIIVVNFGNIKKEVSKKNVKKEDLPKKIKLKMYHIGEKKKQNVSYGYDEEDDIFKYPALDFGGLTNFKQVPGKSYQMNRSFRIDKDTSIPKICNELYKMWKKLMEKKRFSGGIKQGLLKWLESLQLLLKKNNDYAILHFYKQPSHHRIIATRDDVFKKTGRYYVKLFGSDHFAKSSSKKEYYTAIQQDYITTNINKMNLNNEYQKY